MHSIKIFQINLISKYNLIIKKIIKKPFNFCYFALKIYYDFFNSTFLIESVILLITNLTL